MATAVAMQSSPIRPTLAPLPPSVSSLHRHNSSSDLLSRPKPGKTAEQLIGSPTDSKVGPCDGCRRRNSRCAMNEVARKCYSCDFHRQECIFTPNTSRKRSHADSVGGSGWQVTSGGALHNRPPISDLTHGSVDSIPPASSYQHIGSTIDLEYTLLRHLPMDKNSEASFSSSKIRKAGSDGPYAMILDNPNLANQESQALLKEISNISRSNGVNLIKIFFQKIHPGFPILAEKSTIHTHRNNTIDPALLAAIYYVSSKWLETNDEGAPKADASRLKDIAWRQFQSSLARPQVSTVQAGLLLLQCPGLSSHFVSSQLVSTAFDLGLHQDCLEWAIDEPEKGLRKRLAWALYSHDKWSSLLHGRPSFISAANWTVSPLDEQDFEPVGSSSKSEEGNPSALNHSASLFMQLITLTRILAEILDSFYTLKAEADIKAAGARGLRMILEKAKPVQIKLKDWFSCLPAHLKMDAVSESADAPSNGTLHLAYFATEITLHRCIIRATAHEGTDSYLAYICRSAAKTRLISAMDFVNRLRPIHLKSFWPLAGFSNFALIGAFGVLLCATAPTSEEAEFYRMRLEEYRWTLVVSSRNAEFLVYSISSLDTNTGLLENVPEKPELAELVARISGLSKPGQNTMTDILSTLGSGGLLSSSAQLGESSSAMSGSMMSPDDSGESPSSSGAGGGPDVYAASRDR